MTNENSTPKDLLGGPEKPIGAIENGRVFLDRIEQQYSFECEAGPLNNCADWHEVKRCFEFMAEFISSSPTAVSPSELISNLMTDGFMTCVSEPGRPFVKINFPTLQQAQALHAALSTTAAKDSPTSQVMGSKMLWETDADNAAAGAQAVRDILDRKDSPQVLLGGLEHERGIGAALAAPCERHGIPYFECVEAEDIDAILKAYLEGSGLTLSNDSPQVQVRGEETVVLYSEKTPEGGVVRLSKWPEGYVLWHDGEIAWRSWVKPGKVTLAIEVDSQKLKSALAEEDPHWQKLRALLGLDGWHNGVFNGLPSPDAIITHVEHLASERARLLAEALNASDRANVTRIATHCPECNRPKAFTVEEVSTGGCPKWWAIFDAEADADCRRVALGVSGED